MHDNDDIKERRAEMDIYYYKVLILYMKLYKIS